MQAKHTANGINSQVDLVTVPQDDESPMPLFNSRPVLWRAISALMEKNYGGENLNRLARDAKVGPATASRIKGMETSVGLDVIDRVGSVFNVEPWKLLHPDFDPYQATPAPQLSPLAEDLARQLEEIRDPHQQQLAYTLASQVLTLARNVPDTLPTPDDAPMATPSPKK